MTKFANDVGLPNQKFSTGTLFMSFMIAAILDVPGKLLALVACVRIPSNFIFLGILLSPLFFFFLGGGGDESHLTFT